MNLKKKPTINSPPKCLNKINYHINYHMVKLFNITCLSAMLPELIQIQTPEQDVSTWNIWSDLPPQTALPLGSDLGHPRSELLPWTASPSGLNVVRAHHLSLRMGSFKQMQCPGFKATPEQLRALSCLLFCSLVNYCSFMIAIKSGATENVSIWRLFYKKDLASELIWLSRISVREKESRSKSVIRQSVMRL